MIGRMYYLDGERPMTTDNGERFKWARVAAAATPRQTAHEYVHRVLRKAILSGDLPGGARLVQSEIAEQLGVSTTPVREALRNLTSEGLVDFDAHRGGVVRSLSAEELSEILELRALLEPHSIRRAAQRIDKETISELERIYELLDHEEDIASWVDLNRQFHRLHSTAAGLPRLQALLIPLQDATATYTGQAARWSPELFKKAQQDHAAIIDGLRRRDGDALEATILRHIGLPREMASPAWKAAH
jgi:DNA-binding GntR family transcriptional regulator